MRRESIIRSKLPATAMALPKGSRQLSSEKFPTLFPYFYPYLKNFVCFVSVETLTHYIYGAGTLTNRGIITAYHLFNNMQFEKATVSLFVDNYRIAILPILSVKPYKELDIAVCKIPSLYFKKRYCHLGSPNNNNFSFVLAFGAPQGIFGISWQPNIIAVDNKFVITHGFVEGGISGGGIYYQKDGEWYLWAVHSFGYFYEETLYSHIVSL